MLWRPAVTAATLMRARYVVTSKPIARENLVARRPTLTASPSATQTGWVHSGARPRRRADQRTRRMPLSDKPTGLARARCTPGREPLTAHASRQPRVLATSFDSCRQSRGLSTIHLGIATRVSQRVMSLREGAIVPRRLITPRTVVLTEGKAGGRRGPFRFPSAQ